MTDLKRVLLIPMLVAAACMVFVAGPAAADIPGREHVSDSTASDSNDKGVDVSCPGNKWLYASGVDVGGAGRRYVIVDELIPTLNSVRAYAYEYEYGTTLTWTMRVWALCGDPDGSHATVSRQSAYDSTNKGASATCPDGLVVSGTGWEINGALGEVLIYSLIPTSTTVSLEAYEVDAGGSGQYFGSWWVRVYATCVSAPVGYEIINELSASNSDDKNGSATCADKVALGGGFYLYGPLGRINDINLIPTVSAVRTYATEVVGTTNSWPIRTYAICVSP